LWSIRPTNQIGHCTNPCVGCGRIVRSRLWLWDAEDGDDPAGSGDLDLGDQGFNERLALIVAARTYDLVYMIGDLLERGRRRSGRRGSKSAGEFVAAGG
jgi:hypothetical protein